MAAKRRKKRKNERRQFSQLELLNNLKPLIFKESRQNGNKEKKADYRCFFLPSFLSFMLFLKNPW